MSTERFAAFGDHLTASFNAQNIGGRVESAYRFATPDGGVTPFSALQAQSLPNTGLQESSKIVGARRSVKFRMTSYAALR
jgi:uncharacterized protein with beta-barrel porin domain